MKNRIHFLGCPMDLMTTREVLDKVRRLIEMDGPCRVVQFLNANKVAKVAEDEEFGGLLWKADYVLTDGQPMLLLARLLGISVPERIDGIGLMRDMLSLSNNHSFFLTVGLMTM